MKKLILVAVVVVAAWRGYARWSAGSADLKDVSTPGAERASGAVEPVALDALLEPEFAFDDLAEPGSYTVVVVSAKNCKPCRRLQPSYERLASERRDVFVKKIDMFSGRIRFDSKEEADAFKKKHGQIFSKLKEADYCSTPHVLIFDTNAKRILTDDCRDKRAVRFLTQWAQSV